MIAKRLVPVALALTLGAPLAAAAQTAPVPAADLNALAGAYFNDIGYGRLEALAARTSPDFHVVLPDGARLSGDAFLRRTAAHYAISSPPTISLQFGARSGSGTTVTQTVKTSSVDYAFLGTDGQSVEHDFATHQLTWKQSADGKWLLDEDRITAEQHAVT
jgi:hypothetical protein